SAPILVLHSFPTRRSSDLIDTEDLTAIANETGCAYYNAKDANALDEIYATIASKINYNLVDIDQDGTVDGTVIADSGFLANRDRSEEHTSELQSRFDLVCR